jgi:hypothetical protein
VTRLGGVGSKSEVRILARIKMAGTVVLLR